MLQFYTLISSRNMFQGVAEALLLELQRTAEILKDINKLKAQLRTDVTPDEIEAIRSVTEAFVEEIAPLAALMALQGLFSTL